MHIAKFVEVFYFFRISGPTLTPKKYVYILYALVARLTTLCNAFSIKLPTRLSTRWCITNYACYGIIFWRSHRTNCLVLFFSAPIYMNGVGVEILCRTPVPKWPRSYPLQLPISESKHVMVLSFIYHLCISTSFISN